MRGAIVTTTEGPYAGDKLVVVSGQGESLLLKMLASSTYISGTHVLVDARHVKPWTD